MSSGYQPIYEISEGTYTFTVTLAGFVLMRANATTRQVKISVPKGYNTVTVEMLEDTIQTRQFGELSSIALPVSNVTATEFAGCMVNIVFTVSGADGLNDLVLTRAKVKITLSK